MRLTHSKTETCRLFQKSRTLTKANSFGQIQFDVPEFEPTPSIHVKVWQKTFVEVAGRNKQTNLLTLRKPLHTLTTHKNK